MQNNVVSNGIVAH